MEPILKNDFCEMNYESATSIIYCHWSGLLSMKAVKIGGLKMIELLSSKNCHKILNSNLGVKGTFSGASEWIGTEFFPFAIKAGLKHFAWVLANDVFAKNSAQKSVKSGEAVNEYVTQFTDLESAKAWLVSLP